MHLSHPDDGLDVLGEHGPVELVRANGPPDEEGAGATQNLAHYLHPCQSFRVKHQEEEQ